MKVLVRPATDADLPGILDIFNAEILNSISLYIEEPVTLDSRRAWFADHVERDLPVFVVPDDHGKVIGWGALNPYRASRGFRHTVEDSVYVAADQRGLGIGRTLLNTLIEAARDKGKHTILASIDTLNVASIRLHAACGFEQVAIYKEVGFKWNQWMSEAFMQRMITPPTP